jgi:hypothetical protein
MENIFGYVGGGFKEVVRFIESRIYANKVEMLLAGSLGLMFFAIASGMGWRKFTKQRYQSQMELQQAEMKKSLKPFPVNQIEEQGMICNICLTNASNIIFIPCNHLGVCNSCFTEMKQ